MKGMIELVGGPRNGHLVPDLGSDYREAQPERHPGQPIRFNVYDKRVRDREDPPGRTRYLYVLREAT